MNTYLFDFDGTLVDSMPTYVAAMLRILDEHRIPYGEDIVKIITPLGLLGTAKYFVEMGLDRPLPEIVELMRKYMPRLNDLVDKLEEKAHLKGKQVMKYETLGLWLFVALPLPGTGAWTGSLAAAFLGMRLKKAFPAVLLGVITAGCIMLALTHVGINLFSGAV